MEREGGHGPGAEHLAERGIERTELGRVRKLRRFAAAHCDELPVVRQLLRGVPYRVRQPDLLREKQQRAHDAERGSCVSVGWAKARHGGGKR